MSLTKIHTTLASSSCSPEASSRLVLVSRPLGWLCTTCLLCDCFPPFFPHKARRRLHRGGPFKDVFWSASVVNGDGGSVVAAVSPRVKPIMSLSGQIGLRLFEPGQRRRAKSQVQMLQRSKQPGAHSAGLMKSPVLSLHQELKRLWERHMAKKKISQS